MHMDVLSTKEMMAREEEAFRSGITAEALMNAAGDAMARRIAAIYPQARNFLVLVGKGNNGGDGIVVARHLARTEGARVEVVRTAPEDQLGDLPRRQLAGLHAEFSELPVVPWTDGIVFPLSDGIVIDALLGVQARGPLRGVLAEVVARLNQARTTRFFRTVALDLPSGLAAYEEAEAPKEPDAAVVADVTIAVGFAKTVLVREALAGWVGRLEIVAWSAGKHISSARQVLVAPELAGLLPRRSALSYKNTFGKLAIVAGSPGFTGAPVLCAQAAQAIGAGLLSVVTRADAAAIVAAQAPHEAMVSGWTNETVSSVVEKASALAFGPGLGDDADTASMLMAVLDLAAKGVPVVIDADGLNSLAKHPKLLAELKGPLVLTPHVGEMARLIGRKFSHDERETVAREFVEKHKVTLILKGTRTLVAAPGQPLFINTTGNPGLSTGGSGDTLTGILAGLLAQGLAPFDAAKLGVWMLGHAADLVLADRGCEEGLTPTMLSAKLGAALVSLRAQAVAPAGLIERSRELP